MRAGVGRIIWVWAVAMVAVAAVARVMAQTAPALPNEWLVARTGPEVLAAATDVLRSLGPKFERQDLALGLLITRQMPYDACWPEVEAPRAYRDPHRRPARRDGRGDAGRCRDARARGHTAGRRHMRTCAALR